jgi:hypothetical protein
MALLEQIHATYARSAASPGDSPIAILPTAEFKHLVIVSGKAQCSSHLEITSTGANERASFVPDKHGCCCTLILRKAGYGTVRWRSNAMLPLIRVSKLLSSRKKCRYRGENPVHS